MIVDKLENWEHYPFGSGWNRVFEFLMSVTPDLEEKKHEIQGDDIFALVMSYKSLTPETAIIETHREYMDIQTILTGKERIDWFSRDGLSVKAPYDETKDAEFYEHVYPGGAHVDMYPGTFVAFFPQDAHMPALILDNESVLIKKVVVKIKIELLNSKGN